MDNFNRRFGLTLNAILAAVWGIWAFFAIKHLNFITSVIAVGLITTCLLVTIQLAASKNAVVQAAFDESGMLLRPDSRIEDNLRRCLATLGLSGASMFIAWTTDWLYLPLPDGVRQVFPIGGTTLRR